MAIGLFEQLNWLTTRVKRLCCAVDQLQQGGSSYKVYTALLTQSGGNDAYGTQAGTLTVGVTYTIFDSIAGDDFTNVGGPLIVNNNDFNGASFVATATTPANWVGQTGLSYNTGAPVVTVLENTIGNIWWTYNDVGNYYCNSNTLFTPNKTYTVISQTIGDEGSFEKSATTIELSSSIIWVFSGINAAGGTPANGILYVTPIEIRVYN
jgi:hypothetical protein